MRLTTEQLKVINSKALHKVVQAGAGTGKTTLLVAQVEKWKAEGVDLSKVICITFTRRAGASLQKKLAEKGLTVHFCGTVHAFAFMWLRAMGKSFTIIDKDDLEDLVDFICTMNAFPGVAKRRVLEAIDGRVSKNLTSIEEMVLKFLKTYLKQHNMVTPDLLLWHFANMPEMGWSMLRDAVKVVMWDEYQDATHLEAGILEQLAPFRSFLIGDTRQAIYGFRGASADHMRAATGKRFDLTVNFRSGREIVDNANAIMKTEKPLKAWREDLGSVDNLLKVLPLVHMDGVVEGAPWVILCRYNNHVVEERRTLTAQGVNVLVASRDFDKYRAMKWRTLFNCARLVINPACDWLRWAIARDIGEAQIDSVLKVKSGQPITALVMWPGMPEDIAAMSVVEFAIWYGSRDLHDLLPDGEQPDVVVMTAHASKGLEFDNVILRHWDDGLGFKDTEGEETCVSYVAVTRARNVLIYN